MPETFRVNMYRSTASVEKLKNGETASVEKLKNGETASVEKLKNGEITSVEKLKNGEMEINATQMTILSLLSKNPKLTCAAITEQIGISKRNVENNVGKLKAIGALRRKGSTKSGSWKVNGSIALPPA